MVVNETKEVNEMVDITLAKASELHDNMLDALYEKEFMTFFQLNEEAAVEHAGALNSCGLWEGIRSSGDINACRNRVNFVYDEYERKYVDTLNEMCRR